MTEAPLCFLDTETTSLDVERGDVWEIGYILRDHDFKDTERHHRLQPNLANADPTSLAMCNYYPRTRGITWDSPVAVARDIARDLNGRHIVGSVPNFDTAFLTKLLRRYGECPTWHYHLIDVEILAAGWLHGWGAGIRNMSDNPDAVPLRALAPPWRSEDLSYALGVNPPGPDQRHTALGDARWARDIYDAVVNNAGAA